MDQLLIPSCSSISFPHHTNQDDVNDTTTPQQPLEPTTMETRAEIHIEENSLVNPTADIVVNVEEPTRPLSCWNMTEDDFRCKSCDKIPPPLSPSMSNTTRPFVICSKNHVVCHACYVRQADYDCKACGNREPLTHLDVFLQPSNLMEFYKALVEQSYFSCGRLCGEIVRSGKALLEHEEQCTFDPPCQCPMPNCTFEFKWPKNAEERLEILNQHSYHLTFADSSSFPIFVDDIYNENTGDFFSTDKCVVFKPKYDYIDKCPDLKNATTLRKVERLCKEYPPVGVWIDYKRGHEEGSSAKFIVRSKWLQRNSRIIPDGSYMMESRLVSFHTYSDLSCIVLTLNPLKSLSHKFYQTHFSPCAITRLFKQQYTPCTICKYRRKHFHMTNYIYNDAISVCKSRFDL